MALLTIADFGSAVIADFDALDPSTLTLSGTLVSGWANKGSSGNAIGSGTSRPNYAATGWDGTLPCITSDGETHTMVVSSGQPFGDYWWFAVAERDAQADTNTTAWRPLLATARSSGGAQALIGVERPSVDASQTNVGIRGLGAGGTTGNIAGFTVGTKALLFGSVGAAYAARLNGGSPVAGTPGATTAIAFRLFSDTNTARAFKGKVAQFVGIDPALLSGGGTTLERQTIEGVLFWRWGIQASIPGGHPFESAPPTIDIPNSGAFSGTDGADLAALTGAVLVQGSLSAAESADAAALLGAVIIAGALDASEGADTGAFSGGVAFVPIAGALAATDGADQADVSGAVPVEGSLSGQEAADTASLAGGIVVSAALSGIDGADLGAVQGSVVVTGAAAATDGADAASIAGTVIGAGELAGTDGPDASAITGAVLVSGALVAVEGADLAGFDGLVTTGANSGALAGVDGADTASGTGLVLIAGGLAAADGADLGLFLGLAAAVMPVPPSRTSASARRDREAVAAARDRTARPQGVNRVASVR